MFMFFLFIMVLMEKKIIEENGLIDICTPPPPLKLYLQDCG
jgi:hypothetical protein